jgi:hypothetical protein
MERRLRPPFPFYKCRKARPAGGAGREAGVCQCLRFRLLPTVGKQIGSGTLGRLELSADLAQASALSAL